MWNLDLFGFQQSSINAAMNDPVNGVVGRWHEDGVLYRCNVSAPETKELGVNQVHLALHLGFPCVKLKTEKRPKRQ